jgi:hypothetical protein
LYRPPLKAFVRLLSGVKVVENDFDSFDTTVIVYSIALPYSRTTNTLAKSKTSETYGKQIAAVSNRRQWM